MLLVGLVARLQHMMRRAAGTVPRQRREGPTARAAVEVETTRAAPRASVAPRPAPPQAPRRFLRRRPRLPRLPRPTRRRRVLRITSTIKRIIKRRRRTSKVEVEVEVKTTTTTTTTMKTVTE